MKQIERYLLAVSGFGIATAVGACSGNNSMNDAPSDSMGTGSLQMALAAPPDGSGECARVTIKRTPRGPEIVRTLPLAMSDSDTVTLEGVIVGHLRVEVEVYDGGVESEETCGGPLTWVGDPVNTFLRPAGEASVSITLRPVPGDLTLVASYEDLGATENACGEDTLEFTDDFLDGDYAGWDRVDTSCACQDGYVGVEDGVFVTGSGYGEAPGGSQHKFFSPTTRFSPLTSGLRAQVRLRLGGDYQGFGFGIHDSHGGEGDLVLHFNTMERYADGARAHHIHARVEQRNDLGEWVALLDQEVPASWYDGYHDLAIDWYPDRVAFILNGEEVAQTEVPTRCNLDFTLFNARPQRMETDTVEIFAL